MDQELSPKIDFSVIREDRNVGTMRRVAILKFFGQALGSILVLSIIWLAFFGARLKSAYDNGIAAKNILESAQHDIINRDLSSGASKLSQANKFLIEAKESFDGLYGIRWIPFVGRQVKAVDALIDAGVNLTSSGATVVNILDEVTKDIRNESIPFAQLSAEKKREILAKLTTAQPQLEKVQNEISYAKLALEKVKVDGLITPLAEVVNPLQRYLPVMENLVTQAVPIVTALPSVAGFDYQRNYLFLLQNTHELRPTGGFIGTYGVLKIKDGEILDFKTDNIYNLDRAFAKPDGTNTPQYILALESPAPIAKYLEQTRWSLRDINWNPDWPSTAKLALDVYQKENEIARELEKVANRGRNYTTNFPEESFDGVIGVTPELIASLLTLTGPITVDGIRFTAENVQDELEYRVGFEFRELGITEANRKEVVRHLADAIQAKILSLPFSRLSDVAQIGLQSLSAKQVMIYMVDPGLQQMVLERGWAGETRKFEGDYLMVVDSNLGSLKSDQFVERFYDYTLEKINDKWQAKVSVTHKHNGEFAWNSTRLRSYTRIYTPHGSKLISSSGAMYDEESRNPDNLPGQVDVYDEKGKTVFGAFFVTQPRESNTLTFTYELPENVASQIEQGVYSMLYQKQPGANPVLTFNLNFDKTISNSSQFNAESGLFNKVFRNTIKIEKDEELIIKF